MRWPSLEREIRAAKQFLVEGRTAEIFFRERIEAIGLKADVEVRDYGSLDDLGSYLRVFAKRKEFVEGVLSVGYPRFLL
jgi:hypothetical protein